MISTSLSGKHHRFLLLRKVIIIWLQGRFITRYIYRGVGDICDIRLVKSPNNNSRGFGYIEFHTREQVMAALEMDRVKILDRLVVIQLAIISAAMLLLYDNI